MKQASKAFLDDLSALGNLDRATGAMKYFRVEDGGYGHGDVFWGISVPKQRLLSKKHYKLLSDDDFASLMEHEVHEVRLTTLLMMVRAYQKGDPNRREAIAKLYHKVIHRVNNWDLVDSSAHHILGDWYLHLEHDVLFLMAESDDLWTVRVAVIATLKFITNGVYQPTFVIAEKLLNHPHHLIHKAVGWTLREIGNRDYHAEYQWLCNNYQRMPRTMLRYAIEKFDEDIRHDFLKGRI